jgi:hypothetical protein
VISSVGEFAFLPAVIAENGVTARTHNSFERGILDEERRNSVSFLCCSGLLKELRAKHLTQRVPSITSVKTFYG